MEVKMNFFQTEMKNRKLLNYPPYYYMTLIKVKSSDYQVLTMEINKIKEFLN